MNKNISPKQKEKKNKSNKFNSIKINFTRSFVLMQHWIIMAVFHMKDEIAHETAAMKYTFNKY